MSPTLRRAGRIALLAWLAAPVLAMALSLYGEHGMFFWDARTIPCGIEAALRGDDPNAYLRNPTYAGACAGFGYEYMLPPAFTAALVAIAKAVGLPVINAIYGLVYAIALALLAFATRRHADGWREPAAFAALAVCGVFVFELGGGNVTLVFLGLLVGLVAISHRLRNWATWMILLCVAAAAIKPLFALYLFVPLFAGGRWLAVAAASAAVATGYALDAALQPEAFDRWLRLIVPVVYAEPHFGIMRLMQASGLGAGDWLAQGIGYGAWCAAILFALLHFGFGLRSVEDRALAAILAVTLTLPRLKEYDAVVLIPLFFWLRNRLSGTRRADFERLLLIFAFVVPALWWWGRKAALLVSSSPPSLTHIADPRWLIETQGFFLTIGALVMYAFLLRKHARVAERPGEA